MVAEMNRTAAWIVAACLTSVASPVAAAPDAASARAFVEKLYSHYPSNPNRKAFDPTGKNASQVFDPGMIAAFREDTKLANGEVGFVEADPLCQCQDDSGLELSPNFGDSQRVQAAAVWEREDAGLTATSIPLVNRTP